MELLIGHPDNEELSFQLIQAGKSYPETDSGMVFILGEGGNIDSMVETAHSILHPDEWMYYRELKHENRKRSYLQGRLTAKMAIQAYTKADPQSFSIQKGIFNQPVVFGLNNCLVDFSISHTHSTALAVAFDRRFPTGIDVECLNQGEPDYLWNHFNDYEQGLCKEGLNPFILWSAKEALSKSLKTGLTSPFNLYEIIDIHFEQNSAKLSYRYFPQFICRVFWNKNLVYSVSYPSNSEFEWSDLKEKLYLIEN